MSLSSNEHTGMSSDVCMGMSSNVFVSQRPKVLSSLFLSLSEPIYPAWFEKVNSYQYL